MVIFQMIPFVEESEELSDCGTASGILVAIGIGLLFESIWFVDGFMSRGWFAFCGWFVFFIF